MFGLLFWGMFLCFNFGVVQWRFWGGATNNGMCTDTWNPFPSPCRRWVVALMECWHNETYVWGKSLPLIRAPSHLGASPHHCSLSACVYIGNVSEFWHFKKKKSKILFVCFHSYHNLLYIVCPILDARTQVLSSYSQHSYILLSPPGSRFHKGCFRCNGLVHLQNLKFGGSWATSRFHCG